ncbi:MAG: AIR synthase-related protein, partial [Comamonas sp.]
DQGVITGASGRNWASYGEHIQLASSVSSAQKALLTDPQTSGGLLVSCALDSVEQVLQVFADSGFADAAVIGHMEAGEAKVFVD